MYRIWLIGIRLLVLIFFLLPLTAKASSQWEDGLYLGISGGYDVYTVKDHIDFLATQVSSFSLDSQLNTGGVVGGVFAGYRKYFERFFKTYLGLEFFINGSGANTDYEVTLNSAEGFMTEVNVETNYGLSILPAIQLSPMALLYLRLGYNWVNIKVDEVNNDNSFFPYLSFDYHQFATLHGFNYGVGIETVLLKNINLRFEYAYTNYNAFSTDAGTTVTSSDNQLLAGLLYHF